MKFFNTEGLPDFKAGAARHCITPPVGVSLYGYFHDRIGTYVKDDLFCHAMVIEGDGGKIVLVSLDLGCIPQPQVLQAKKLIEEQTSISGSNVLICATHTHTGPVMSPYSFLKCDTEWLAALPGKIADTVADANSKLQPVLLVPATTIGEDLGSNRLARQADGSERFTHSGIGPAGPVDKQLHAIRVCNMDGETVGMLVNFAQHADNIGGATADFISADWPGQVWRTISQVYGDNVVTVFLNGCCGDLNMSFDHPSRRTPSKLPRNISMGRAIGGLAIAATEQAEPMERNKIAARVDFLDIPYYTRDAALDAEVEAEREKSKATGKLSPIVVMRDNWQFDGKIAHVPVQVMQCGDIIFVGLPGEIFTSWGLEIKHWSPAKFTVVVELANGYFQYIPTTDQAQRGAYGAKPILSRCLEAEAGRKMADRVQVMMYEIFKK